MLLLKRHTRTWGVCVPNRGVDQGHLVYCDSITAWEKLQRINLDIQWSLLVTSVQVPRIDGDIRLLAWDARPEPQDA